MKAQDFTGHYNMNADPPKRPARLFVNLLFAGAGAWSCLASAEEFPADAEELNAESAQKIEEPGARRDWRLDPAVFTEISPVTASETAIKLPEDQREEG